MNKFRKDIYYTHDHEWIDFQGSVAYIGLCSFKLSGFREIHQITFTERSDALMQGATVATIKYRDYTVQLHMPVDGRIMQINDILFDGEKHALVQHPENSGWIALIVPLRPNDRMNLLTPEEYIEKNTLKYAR